jgi:hypothetical protein
MPAKTLGGVAYFDLPGLPVEFSRRVEQTAEISSVFVKAPEITAARARQEEIRSKRLKFFNSGSENQEITGSQRRIEKDFGIGGAPGPTG